jgi:hypothetical protein
VRKRFNCDVIDVPITDTDFYPQSVINTANYLLVRDNGDGIQTSSCSVGVTGGDLQVIIDSVDYSNHGAAGRIIATLNVYGGNALPVGTYWLIV